mmetsp:Transcript_14527/g.39149  ORF Transcript_14527/g.39149 Transcript_14527/m.39149 type:complete len:251 (-) Transcript_14527:24-776(-)
MVVVPVDLAQGMPPARVDEEEGREERHLDVIEGDDADGRAAAEIGVHGQVAQPPGEEGGCRRERGHGHGAANVVEGPANGPPAGGRAHAPRPVFGLHAVEGVGEDDHVVYGHAEEREADEGRHGGDGNAEDGRHAQARAQREAGACERAQAEEVARALLVAAPARDGEAHVEQHHGERHANEVRVVLDEAAGLLLVEVAAPGGDVDVPLRLLEGFELVARRVAPRRRTPVPEGGLVHVHVIAKDEGLRPA